MTDETIPRRKFLVGAGLAGTAVAAGLAQTEHFRLIREFCADPALFLETMLAE